MRKVLLPTTALTAMLLMLSCNNGKYGQTNKEQDSIEIAAKKAYKDLTFGMPIEEVKKLGYLGEQNLSVNLEDIDENGEINFKEEVNGIKSYACTSTNIGNYNFNFVSLEFANDTLVQVKFQKNMDFKSTLNVAYKELKTLLNSNFGNPVMENVPNFTIPADCDVLKYQVGTKEVKLSLNVDEEGVMMGFDNCYFYIIEITDMPRYNKKVTDTNKSSDI